MDSIHPLKAFREKHAPPLSQQQLADLLKRSRVTVTRWESGDRRIPPEDLQDISDKTGIPTAVLRPDLAALFERHGPARPRAAKARVKSRAA